MNQKNLATDAETMAAIDKALDTNAVWYLLKLVDQCLEGRALEAKENGNPQYRYWEGAAAIVDDAKEDMIDHEGCRESDRG